MRTAPTPPVQLADLRDSAELAKRLIKALDIDNSGKVDDSEVKRIQVRDHFVSRNLVDSAIHYAAIPIDSLPDLESAQYQIDRAVRSAERADQNQNGTVEQTEWAAASNVARNLGKFTAAHAGDSLSVFDIKPFEKPGTAEWVELAKREYFDPTGDGSQNYPYFGTALVIPRNELPEAVRGTYDQLKTQYPDGKVEAISSDVNGQLTYFVHVKEPRVAHAALVLPDGEVVGRATASATHERAHSKPWSIDWE